MPFSNEPRLLYRWSTWSFSVTSEHGEQVASDKEIPNVVIYDEASKLLC